MHATRRALLQSSLAGLTGLAVAYPALGQGVAVVPATALPAGMVGEFHPAAGATRGPAVLVLGGSEGGLASAAGLAKRVAAHGITALGLAYFAAPGLPATMEEVPLEYFTRAIDWLSAQPMVDPGRIGIMGGSKGAEAALLIASREPRLHAVVAGMPSCVVWDGINMAHPMAVKPSWTSGGAPVPYTPYDVSAPFAGLLDFYQRSLDKAPAAATILVERIKGPVLLISGDADTLWPSSAMAKSVMARLDAAKFPYAHRHLAYADAGHAVFGPPLPADSPNLPRLAALGGTPGGNQAARADSWPKALTFLDEALRAPKRG